MVQLILNPAYLPITDVSKIGLFGEILPDESVSILIRPFPQEWQGRQKQVSAANASAVRVCRQNPLPLSMVTVCTLSLCAFNALTAVRAVSSALRFFNLQMMVWRVTRSTKADNALF